MNNATRGGLYKSFGGLIGFCKKKYLGSTATRYMCVRHLGHYAWGYGSSARIRFIHYFPPAAFHRVITVFDYYCNKSPSLLLLAGIIFLDIVF